MYVNFEIAALFPWPYSRVKKRGNFKTNIHLELFLYYLSSKYGNQIAWSIVFQSKILTHKKVNFRIFCDLHFYFQGQILTPPVYKKTAISLFCFLFYLRPHHSAIFPKFWLYFRTLLQKYSLSKICKLFRFF